MAPTPTPDPGNARTAGPKTTSITPAPGANPGAAAAPAAHAPGFLDTIRDDIDIADDEINSLMNASFMGIQLIDAVPSLAAIAKSVKALADSIRAKVDAIDPKTPA